MTAAAIPNHMASRPRQDEMRSSVSIKGFADPDFDPFFSEKDAFGDVLDPYATLDEMMAAGSVHPVEYRTIFGARPNRALGHLEHYTIVGYDAVREVLNKPDVYLNQAFALTLGTSFGKSISTMDAPEHQRYRRIFQKAFLPQVVSQWGETLVEPVVANLFDAFAGRGSADLIKQFTHHYPFNIIYRQLALPDDAISTFHQLAVAETLYAIYPSEAAEAGRNLGDYFDGLIDERLQGDGNDLVSLLARAEVDGERLPRDVLVSFFRQLMNAAGDTTYRATSVLFTALLEDPGQLDLIRQDRTLISPAIEEAVRWEGPVLVTSRMTAEDTVLDGVPIPRGAYLHVVLGSANRDARKFPDPHRFDLTRQSAVRHFGFAMGPHICLGQHLARVEMTRAVNALLDRLPNVRLDEDKPAPEIRGFLMRAPEHLHVRFDS